MTRQDLKTEAAQLLEQRRYLALWLPFLATERQRRAGAGDTPFVLAERTGNALRIAACDAEAQACGLRRGMTLAEARARIPMLAVGETDHAADRGLLLKLASSCEIFTPLFAPDGEDGIILDITGCDRLFGGEAAMLATVCHHMEARGFTPRAAMAGTPDAAHALSRFKAPCHVAPGGEEAAVSDLPVAALEEPAETETALIRAGLKTLGDLAARPSRMLSARFGAAMATKLDRILGRENIRFTPFRPPPDLTAERRFPEPLQQMESLGEILRQLCGEIATELERRGAGGRGFEAAFFRSDGEIRRLAIETARPTREAKSLFRLLALRLETLASPIDPGFGFDALRLSVLGHEPLARKQRRFDGKAEDRGAMDELIDRLIARFGRDRVVRFIARDSHDPSRIASAVPVASPEASAPWRAAEDPLPRPLQVFDPPQVVDVMAEVPDGPPLRFRWRRVLHEVAGAEGPERIAPEWWRAGSRKNLRDYYQVEDTQGRRFWIFRDGLFAQGATLPRWYLHGLFP